MNKFKLSSNFVVLVPKQITSQDSQYLGLGPCCHETAFGWFPETATFLNGNARSWLDKDVQHIDECFAENSADARRIFEERHGSTKVYEQCPVWFSAPGQDKYEFRFRYTLIGVHKLDSNLVNPGHYHSVRRIEVTLPCQ